MCCMTFIKTNLDTYSMTSLGMGRRSRSMCRESSRSWFTYCTFRPNLALQVWEKNSKNLVSIFLHLMRNRTSVFKNIPIPGLRMTHPCFDYCTFTAPAVCNSVAIRIRIRTRIRMKSRIQIRIKDKSRTRIHNKLKAVSWEVSQRSRGGCRPVDADLHHCDEDPDPHDKKWNVGSRSI